MRSIILLVMWFALASCGAGGPEARDGIPVDIDRTSTPGEQVEATTGTSEAESAPDATATSSDTAPSRSLASAVPSEEDLAVFVAVVEELVAGTIYESAALDEPELFIATGRLMCDRLDAGRTMDAVLTEYLDELAGGVDQASDDEVVLAGALYGGATGALCTQHLDTAG